MAEPSTSYSLSSRGKKKRSRSPNDSDEQPPDKNQTCTSLEDNLIFNDTMIALQLMRTQFPKLEKVVTQPFILQSQLYSSVKDRTQVDRDLESMKKDKVLRIFKLSSGQDDHAIMFMDDYLKQVASAVKRSGCRDQDGGEVFEWFERYVINIKLNVSINQQELFSLLSRGGDVRDKHITLLMNAGLLTRQLIDPNIYWFAIPSIGPVLKGLSQGRKEILSLLNRKKYKEMLLSSLEKTRLREYLPMGGSMKMIEESLKLAYGEDSEFLKDKRIAAVQALSGTGACRLFADFQKRFLPDSQIYIPTPTWSNHHNIWRDARVPQRTYTYYHPESRGLDFAGLMNDIQNAQDGSFFLLHACAHNPTGVDPSEEQWREISFQFKAKKHFPFFDMAYQGFASGDPERDAKAIRIFLEDGHQIGCAQSYAKNMGLYGQRAGCLSILCDDEMQAVAVKSQLQQIARPMYSNPPLHGALIVSTILSDPELKNLWLKEVKGMADRIIGMRKALKENLESLGSSLSWEHITNQIGMFCYSGMTPEQVDRLTNEFHIYMTRNGRISMAGVTSGNVAYLANAIHEVTKAN